MGVNTQIKEFQQKVLSVINQENLPVEVKRLAMVEVMHAINDAVEREIKMEAAQEMAEKKEGNNECME